jgi:secondary thiamine-phosphate synthase enzyme
MSWHQRTIRLEPRPRGFHLVTREILAAWPELGSCRIGIAHLFLQHTSASLILGENADPDVLADLERYFSRAVPDGSAEFRHVAEGADDMPAHVKSAMLGVSLSVPVRAGKLALGTWQGIYLCEHRNEAGSRTLVATLHGE